MRIASKLGWSILVILISLFAYQQMSGTRARAGEVENARHAIAVELLRSINTAELDFKLSHGKYATWDTLFQNGDFTATGTKWAAKYDPRLATSHFSNATEVLPGWMLRLNLTSDGKAYDLLLEDSTDMKCGYAAITDERGVIRQGKAIDCPL